MRISNYYLLNRLINQEFPEAYRQITTHLEGEAFEVEDVQQAYNMVKAKVDNLEYIKSNQTLHILTGRIAALNETRHEILQSLKGRVVYGKKSHKAEEREAADYLHVWITRERGFLTSKNSTHQSRSVRRMVHDMSLNSEFGDALEVLGMFDIVDSLKNITSQIDAHKTTREKDKLADTRKANAMRREAYLAMKSFVMSIELAMVLKKGDDAKHLDYLNAINLVVTTYHARHQSRMTGRRNAAENAKVEAEAQAKAKAKAEAEAKQNEQPGEGVQYGANVVTMGGKPAPAGRSVAFKTMSMDDMDLQNEGATMNVAMKSAPAMNEQANNGGVNDGVNDGVNEKANDASAGAQGMSDSENRTLGDASATQTTTDDATATTHHGATTKDDDGVDHES